MEENEVLEETTEEVVGNESALDDIDFDIEEADDWSDAENDALNELDEEDTPVDESKFEDEEPVMEEEVLETKPVDRTFDYTYMGETKKASLDDEDFISTYQKGKNYDNLKNKYDNDRARTFIEKLAKEEGKTVDEYIDITEASLMNNAIEEIMEDEGVSESVAREIYSYRQSERQNAYARKIQENEQKAQEDRQAQFNEFLDLYPNVNPDSIPMSVWDRFNAGVPLKYAYMEFENSQLKTNYKQIQTNATNRRQEVTVGNSNSTSKVKESWEAIWDED